MKHFRGLLGQIDPAKGAAQVEDREEGGIEWRDGQSDATKKEIRTANKRRGGQVEEMAERRERVCGRTKVGGAEKERRW